MELTVRLATPEDIPAIMEITHDAFTRYQRDLGLPGKVAALKETEETVLEELRSKVVFIGLVDGCPVGSVRYAFYGNLAYVSRFGVRSDYQKVGMGSALMKAVEAHCAPRGADGMALHTCAHMTGLMRFYYRQGFYVDSTSRAKGYNRALLIKPMKDFEPVADPVAQL